MAHFAQIDIDGTVLRVLVISQEVIDTGAFGAPLSWKKTSFNTKEGVYCQNGDYINEKKVPFRKNFAGVGHKYDEARDAFIPKKPFDSWILDEDTCLWNAPVECPGEIVDFVWNEDNLSWDLIETLN